MANFKVGDKVRILDAEKIICGDKHWDNGDITEVIGFYNHHPRLLAKKNVKQASEDGGLYIADNELKYIEKVSSKPTKNQRISTLEQQVAELQAEVEALKKAHKSDADIPSIASKLAKFIEGKAHTPELTPNEKRKAIIAEAKAFVEGAKVDFYGSRLYEVGVYMPDVEFIVNKEKRAVTALLYWHAPIMKIYGEPRELKAKGLAKCAPDDVFNADIGKAIALGRALGLDVSKFENAVKPTEAVVGQVIEVCFYGSADRTGQKLEVSGIRPDKYPEHPNGTFTSHYAIMDDTEAQY